VKTALDVLVVAGPQQASTGAALGAQLARAGLRLHRAPSAAQAERRRRRAPVDCLLVDGAGVGAAASAAPDLPIVAMADAGDHAAALRALRAGADDCVDRDPLDPEALARAVRFAVERHRVRGDLAHRALHDPLTGLPNRQLLDDRLEHGLAALRRHGGAIALLFVDLDAFKPINDTLGHQAGDTVLVEVAQRLEAAVRPSDTVARFGGDEFAVLCEAAGDPDAVLAIARRLAFDIGRPIDVGAIQVAVSASIGVAFADADACDAGPAALLRRADAAMYLAKHGDQPIAVAARQAASSAG
jgi:diguanylate cyclase (GGDEF)-like protein